MKREICWCAWGALVLLTAACGGPSDDESEDRDTEEPPDGDGDRREPLVPAVETSGGMDLVPHEAHTGSVTIVGSSDAVPVSNRSFTGFREGANDGDELVRCNYYPSGDLEYPPYVEVLAGIEGNEFFQAQLQVFGYPSGQEEEFLRSPDDSLEEGTQDMILFASLTHDNEATDYKYWYGVDEYAYPPYGSSCTVQLSGVEDSQLQGTVSCAELFPVPGSPDYPVTNAASPQARVSLQFDCPLVERDPGGGIVEPETTGSCEGSPSHCILADRFSCSLIAGCTLGGSCSGSARECDFYPTGDTCEYQSGCQWSGFSCGGFPKSCYSLEDDFSCNLQSGCAWDDRCDGEAVGCSAFVSEFTCETQGCRWEEDE